MTTSPSAASPSAVRVSVVIPCLDEVATVAACVEEALTAMRGAGIAGEVVVADNGSTDGSPEAAAASGARVVPVLARGYGSALSGGIAAARGEVLVIGDADGSYDFGDVPRFVEKIDEGFGVVMGNRFAGGIERGAMPWSHRYIGNPVLSGILRVLFRPGPIHDSHCGIRAFRRDVYERMDMRTTGMEFASEFVIKAAAAGARMTELPVVLRPGPPGRRPHLRSFPDGWRHLRFMLLLSPNWLFILPGCLVGLLGFGLVAWLMPGQRSFAGQDFGLHTMLFGMLLALVGLQVASIGVYARVFRMSEGLGPPDTTLARAMQWVTLERGLAIGACFLLVGSSGIAWLLWRWISDGAEAFEGLRQLIGASLLCFVGMHIVFSSFFLSMLGISRGEHVGNYDQDSVSSTRS